MAYERGNDGDPLWLPVRRDGSLEIPPGNLERSLQAEIAAGAKQGCSGDGSPATQARLSHPDVVAVDAAGNPFIAGNSPLYLLGGAREGAAAG